MLWILLIWKISAIKKCKIAIKSKFKASKCFKMAVFALLQPPKLIYKWISNVEHSTLNRLDSSIIIEHWTNLKWKLATLFLIPLQTDMAKRVVANNERQIESQDRICQSPVKTAWETTSWYISLQCFLSILSFWLDFPLLRNRCLFC